MEKKKELRKRIALLKTLHKSTATHQSAEILAALEAHPVFRAASIILLYHSLPDEVHTHDFIRKWSTKKKILLPVVIGNDLELRVYTSPADLAIGAYGIEEPTGALFTDYATIDLVIVPGVAFDRDGNRLVRGKGYYDRLLPRIPSAYKVGICFPFQIVEEVPAEPFDIRMVGETKYLETAFDSAENIFFIASDGMHATCGMSVIVCFHCCVMISSIRMSNTFPNISLG